VDHVWQNFYPPWLFDLQTENRVCLKLPSLYNVLMNYRPL
jgi:hypothetical protein